MRRTILFVAVAVLTVMALPVAGIGQPTSSHGGAPSDVFMSTHSKKCVSVGRLGSTAMPTAIAVGADSHLIVNFTSEWGGLDQDAEGLLGLALIDAAGKVVKATKHAWSVAGAQATRTSASVMWTFKNVHAGDYTVQAFARVELPPHTRSGASLNDCALTVFVAPAA